MILCVKAPCTIATANNDLIDTMKVKFSEYKCKSNLSFHPQLQQSSITHLIIPELPCFPKMGFSPVFTVSHNPPSDTFCLHRHTAALSFQLKLRLCSAFSVCTEGDENKKCYDVLFN